MKRRPWPPTLTILSSLLINGRESKQQINHKVKGLIWCVALFLLLCFIVGYGPEAISAEEQSSNFIIHSLAFLPSLVKLSLKKKE